MTAHPARVRRPRLVCAAAALLALTLLAAPALAHDHDASRSGHPLRVMAYVLHPVGWLLDTLIFRPADWLVSHEPLATVFGHQEDE